MANNFNFTIGITLPPGAEQALTKAAEKAFRQTADILNGRFDDAISSAAWDWPRPSKRGVGGGTLSEVSRNWKNAKFNTNSPRSIVDSGDLKQNKTFTVSGLNAEWVWGSSYAAWVHDGARIHPWGNQKVTVELPARPWTTAVLQGGNPEIEVYDFASELGRRIPNFL